MTCYTDSPMDAAMAAGSPVYTMAHDGALPVLPVGGRGYLLSRDALFVIGRGVGFTALIVSAELPTPTPFGVAHAGVYFDGDKPSMALIRAAGEAAIVASPTEWAGALVADECGNYCLQAVGVSSASPGHVTYGRSTYDDAALVVDMHSHGAGHAYFSATDDASDSEGVHIAAVFGCCTNRDALKILARVSIYGLFMSLSIDEWTHDAEIAA